MAVDPGHLVLAALVFGLLVGSFGSDITRSAC
jgi:hypothetical protein